MDMRKFHLGGNWGYTSLGAPHDKWQLPPGFQWWLAVLGLWSYPLNLYLLGHRAFFPVWVFTEHSYKDSGPTQYSVTFSELNYICKDITSK